MGLKGASCPRCGGPRRDRLGGLECEECLYGGEPAEERLDQPVAATPARESQSHSTAGAWLNYAGLPIMFLQYIIMFGSYEYSIKHDLIPWQELIYYGWMRHRGLMPPHPLFVAFLFVILMFAPLRYVQHDLPDWYRWRSYIAMLAGLVVLAVIISSPSASKNLLPILGVTPDIMRYTYILVIGMQCIWLGLLMWRNHLDERRI